jgi:hypothetical protein
MSVSVRTVSAVQYRVKRLTFEMQATPRDFRARFEEAVPPAPMDRLLALIERRAPWEEMVDLVLATAPFGFLVYDKTDAGLLMRSAGDTAVCVTYQIGNHIIAHRIFRHDPSVMLYAPLRAVITGDPQGAASLTLDKPSDQFRSFGNPDIAVVGVELDRKLATLLEHLNVDVPEGILA